MAVQTKRYSQDGIQSVYIRELVAGVGTGNWFKVGGVNSLSISRETTERELLGDNATYRKTSKFKQFSGTMQFYGQAWEMLAFFIPGTLNTSGNKTTFSESTTGQPTKFEMAVFSDADEEGGDVAVMCEHFKNCQATNWNNAKTSGEYVTFEVTFTGLGNDSGIPRDLILDEDLVGMDVTGDDTAPTVSDVDASSGTFPGAVDVDANILVDFSEEMLEATITTTNLKLIKISDGSVVAAAVTYTPGAPYRATINPNSSLSSAATYMVLVRNQVRDEAGNFMAADYTTTFTTA